MFLSYRFLSGEKVAMRYKVIQIPITFELLYLSDNKKMVKTCAHKPN